MPKYNKMPEGNSPQPHISAGWQEQLSKLLGNNPYGQPKLRLVWGQTTTHFFMERERLKYIRSRQPVHTGYQVSVKDEETGEIKVVGKYPSSLTPPVVPPGHIIESLGRMETIGVDRWFIELWRGPRIAGGGHTPQSWESSYRYKCLYDSQLGIYRMVDVHGEFPFKGEYGKAEYAYPWMISRHDRLKACCAEREEKGLLCLGEYRAPEQRDIDFIAFLIAEEEKRPYQSGYDEIAPESAIRSQLSEVLSQEAKEEEKKDKETDYRLAQIRQRQALQAVHFDIRRD